MKPENTMKIEFPSFSRNEAFARGAVAAFLAWLDPTMEEMGDIKTAVSEAVTNAIVHGYPHEQGTILLTCNTYSDRTVEIEVEDRGVGIANIQEARTPMFTTGGSDRSGMGFTIMEKFMHDLSVESHLGEGTKVRMTRKLRKTGGFT